jgi:hypothetical protein
MTTAQNIKELRIGSLARWRALFGSPPRKDALGKSAVDRGARQIQRMRR